MAPVQVIGLGKATAFIKAASLAVINKADKGVHEAGFYMEGEVKASIAGQRGETKSVDTGRFLSSVSTDNSKKLQSKISTNVPYAKALEHGTSKLPARNHFSNSASRNKHVVVEFIEAEVKTV